MIEDDPIEVRKAKRQQLIEQGVEPYARSFEVRERVSELEERYADLEDGATTTDVVSIAGRIVAIRDQGKVAFIVLRDAQGDIQLFCKVDTLGEEAFAEMKNLDVGDWSVSKVWSCAHGAASFPWLRSTSSY